MILPCKLTPRAKFHWGRSPILVSPRSGGQVLVVSGTLVQSIGTPAWPISNISISFSWGSKQSNRCQPRILAHFCFWFSLGSPVATGPLPGHDSSRSSVAVQVGPATKIRVVPSRPSTLCVWNGPTKKAKVGFFLFGTRGRRLELMVFTPEYTTKQMPRTDILYRHPEPRCLAALFPSPSSSQFILEEKVVA